MKVQTAFLRIGTVALITFCSEHWLNVTVETNLGVLIWVVLFGNSEAIDAGQPNR